MGSRRYRDRLHRLLAVDPQHWWYVPDLVGILSRWGGFGAVYIALDDLIAIGCVETRWEPPFAVDDRPRRRLYRLVTRDGG